MMARISGLMFALCFWVGCACAQTAMIVDLTGDVMVKHATVKNGAGGEVQATIGMQVFAGDTLTSAADASVTLFDESAGTSTNAISATRPYTVGAQVKQETRGFGQAMAASIKGLFVNPQAAGERETATGAVEAGMMLARAPELDKPAERDAKKSDGAPGRPRTARAKVNQAGDARGASQPVAPSQQLPEASSAGFAKTSLPDPAGGSAGVADNPTGAPGGNLRGESEAAAGASGQAQSVEGASQPSVAPSGDSGAVVSEDLEGGKDGAGLGDKVGSSRKTTKGESVAEPPLLDQIATLDLAAPLARAWAQSAALKQSWMKSTDGVTVVRAGRDRELHAVDETLSPGTKITIHVRPADQAARVVELQLKAADARWLELAKGCRQLEKNQIGLAGARVLRMNGYLLAAYAMERRAVTRLEQAHKSPKALRGAWLELAAHALELGDWTTVKHLRDELQKPR